MKFQLKSLTHALGAGMVLTLAACGGGGSSTDTPVAAATGPSGAAPAVTTAASGPAVPVAADAPAPAPVVLTGVVTGDLAVRNAVVCLDLNANNSCDAGEPSSARTGVDGSYSLSYDPSKVTAAQIAAASLIAPMVPGPATDPATTIDAFDPGSANTAKPYVLKQLPGKSGQINPLTTLVAQGVADGMTEADARANTAIQLKIDGAKIDDYQGDAATDDTDVQDSARRMARVVKTALEAGARLSVGNQLAAVEPTTGNLASLRYTDAANYFVRTFARVAKQAGTTGVPTLDLRSGRTTGSVSNQYNFAYLAPSGWTRCDGPWEATSGNPSRSTYCGASQSVGFTVPASIEGRTMSDVVTEMQADPTTNVVNNGVPTNNLLAALGAAVFPAGSAIDTRYTLNVNPGILINSVSGDDRPQSEAQSLEQLIATKSVSNVTLPAPSGSLTLGLGSGNFRNLRVAFTGATSDRTGTVQFYECDLDTTQSIATNCAATQTGTYAISTMNGVRVMRFAGHPLTVMNHTRVYVEVQNAPGVAEGNWVYQARESKRDIATASALHQRLSATAWTAMKALLGL